jgi:hypothetical protein
MCMAGLMMLFLSHKATQLLPAVQKEERRNSELQHPGGTLYTGVFFFFFHSQHCPWRVKSCICVLHKVWISRLGVHLLKKKTTHICSGTHCHENFILFIAGWFSGKTEIRKSGITFYTAPVPFEGTESVRQKLAIHSWLRLKPCPNVVLMGRHPSIISFASSLQPRVSVDSDIEFT